MENSHAQQMKELEAAFEVANREMKTSQARLELLKILFILFLCKMLFLTRVSVECVRDVQNDKTIKTKQEKDRRV